MIRAMNDSVMSTMRWAGLALYMFEMYPREGFLLWVVGMGLVVSSPELSRLVRRPVTS